MSEPVIRIENLGKRYILRHRAAGAGLLRDRLVQLARTPFSSARRDSAEEFWALKELNLEVTPGEVIGVIGRNGAGKSTLLKILSRITEPTEGRVTIHGRVASLLEVGTGFHPELTGRENIHLNGAILGMSRREIRAKFDEIVAFAEVERFLDTPVKHYSSGMYVRLAFAVAAHLEPEILIVDEVLAVGDTRFQEKCLGKIRSVAETEGRTVLIVSHNLSVILSLCDRALLLRGGRADFAGPAEQAVQRYLAASDATRYVRQARPITRCGIEDATLSAISCHGQPFIQIVARITAREAIRPAFEVKLHNHLGEAIAFGGLGSFNPRFTVELHPGEQTISCRFPSRFLANGRYGVSLKLCLPFVESLDEADHCLAFDHELPPAEGASHVLQQAWNSGSVILDLERTA